MGQSSLTRIAKTVAKRNGQKVSSSDDYKDKFEFAWGAYGKKHTSIIVDKDGQDKTYTKTY